MSYRVVVPPMPTKFGVDCPKVVFEAEILELREIAWACREVYTSKINLGGGLCQAVANNLETLEYNYQEGIFGDSLQDSFRPYTSLEGYLNKPSALVSPLRHEWAYHISRSILEQIGE